jgi:zinc protease
MPRLAESATVTVDDPLARLQRLRWVWHSPARFGADDVDLEVLADVLGRGGWGRLYKKLVVEERLAQSVDVSQWGKGFSGQFDIAVTLKPGADRDRAERVVRATLLELLDAGPTEAEVRRSRLDTETNLLFSLDELLARTEQLQLYNHYLGDPGGLTRYLGEVRTRTPASVRDAARRWLAKPRVLVVTVPAGPPSSAPSGATR